MIRTNGNRRAFTLVELLVVVGMIALLMGAFASSVTAAQQRARIQKATSDVKVITQAILAYENFGSGGNFELPTMKDRDADQSSIGFLLGDGGTSQAGDQIPVLLMASLQSGGKMLDPWGTPYTISITKGSGNVSLSVGSSNMKAGYFLPNLYRVGPGERDIWKDGEEKQ